MGRDLTIDAFCKYDPWFVYKQMQQTDNSSTNNPWFVCLQTITFLYI